MNEDAAPHKLIRPYSLTVIVQVRSDPLASFVEVADAIGSAIKGAVPGLVGVRVATEGAPASLFANRGRTS